MILRDTSLSKFVKIDEIIDTRENTLFNSPLTLQIIHSFKVGSKLCECPVSHPIRNKCNHVGEPSTHKALKQRTKFCLAAKHPSEQLIKRLVDVSDVEAF